ncbi:YcjF family protein [Aureimonas psammosilenae]|uniref:YcjF family protein n=1 Tax=Aureimonas psammosilenae TaxID=2495496 RepID=UPI0012607FB0|nr:TIGR01620 family protein [Aureimonas psammosilenae]
MSDEPTRRAPAAFRLDASQDDRPLAEKLAETELHRAPRALDDLSAVELDAADIFEREEWQAEAILPPKPRGFPFAKLFFAALGALVSVAVGLAVDDLVRNLFTRADWLGWLAVALAVLLALGAFGVVAREIAGLMRLKAVEEERKAAARAFELDSASEATAVVSRLTTLLAAYPETAEGRTRLAALKDEVIDGRDLLTLAERELLLPIDRRARALVMTSAKRVSVVTAVSPKAIVDISYVLFENIRLIRQMSELYGARPGAIGLVKLTRDVLGHLAVTGSISIGDSIVGQVVGHGLAARLSARLGEGVVNGLLTARVGIAAMDLCRPLPFIRSQRPRIADFMGDLTALQGDARKPQRPGSSPIGGV